MYNLFDSIRKKFGFGSIEPKDTQPNVTWQHKWSFNETKDALSESSIVAIPNEILLLIFQLLSVRDLCNISLVCRLFKMIADQDETWKLKYNTSTKLYSKSFKQIYMDWIHEKCLRNIELRQHISSKWYRTGCALCSTPSYSVQPIDRHQFKFLHGFNQHPNSSLDMTIKLSVDIDNTARELIKLLEKSSIFQQQWQKSSVLKQMITRYYRFMQLKACHSSNILLIPTLDIEIIWQTHLLRPEMYQSDCLRLFHRIIDHSLLMTDIQLHLKEQAFQNTCQLHEQKFNEQYFPLSSIDEKKNFSLNFPHYIIDSYTYTNSSYSYFDKPYLKFSLEPPKDYENPFSFTETEIIMDFNWLDMCKKFMYDTLQNVPIPTYHHYQSTRIDLGRETMKRLKKSYERFLYMAAKHPLKDGNGFIPPTYAIDIIWHSHMQEPLNYVDDCNRLVGYVIFHAPWPIIENDTMNKTHDVINNIWKNEFQTDITKDHLNNTIQSLSFNQPKFCPNASWNPNGTVFSSANSGPYGIFVHINNTVYVTEQDNNQIQVWSSVGGLPIKTISYFLDNPGAIFVTMNNDIYVDSGANNRVEKWTSNAVNGIIVMNVTAQCLGLFIDINNTLYCSASDQHQVLAQSLNQGTHSVSIVAGSDTYGSASDQLYYPNGIFVDTNFNLYVADYYNSRIQKFQLGQPNAETVAGYGAPKTIDLWGPIAVILDADNYLFITDSENNRVVGSGPNGFRCLVGCSQQSGLLINQVDGPRGLGFDSYGNLLVIDRGNDRILKFTLMINSCGQDGTATSIRMTNTTGSTNRKGTVTTIQQTLNSYDRTNRLNMHLIIWLAIVTLNAVL